MRNSATRRDPLIVGLHSDSELIVANSQVSIAITQNRVRLDGLNFLSHDADVGRAAAVIHEAIEPHAAVETADERYIVFETDVGPPSTATTAEAATTAVPAAGHRRATTTEPASGHRRVTTTEPAARRSTTAAGSAMVCGSLTTTIAAMPLRGAIACCAIGSGISIATASVAGCAIAATIGRVPIVVRAVASPVAALLGPIWIKHLVAISAAKILIA